VGVVPRLGVTGWVSHCLGGVQVGVSLSSGDRVGVSPFWGWPGGCVTVWGVTGWMSHCFGGGRVGVVPRLGWISSSK
jgi:hypothetical protein